MRYFLSAVSFLALCLPAPGALAQEDEFFDLGTLILAGGLSPAPAAALPRAVSVLTGEELEQRGLDQAVEALRALPGVAVNRSGGPGGLTQVRLRGTEGRHVLVLLDGVRLDPAQNGEFDFAGLQSADIERIEVVRGPQSVFFGSNTIGGVISITTRRATQPGFSGQAGVETGSDGTLALSTLLGWRGERGGLTLSGILRNEGGYDISATPGGQNDGMRNRTLNLAGDWQLTDDWRVGLLLRRRNQTNETDPEDWGPVTSPGDIVYDRNDFTRLQERIGSVFAEGDLAEGRLRLTLRASRFDLDTRRFNDAVESGDTSADRRELSMRGVWALDGGTVEGARHTLGFGLDHTREGFVHNNAAYVSDPSQLIRQGRSNTGLSLEYRGTLAEGFDVQAGLRRDLNDGFANFTTWSLGASYALAGDGAGSGTRLRASLGTGVQNPTLFNQFGFIPGSFIGNPDLRPEQSRGWDIGIDQFIQGGAGQISATYFDNRLTDRITTIGWPVSTPVNSTGVSHRRGVELSYEGQITDRLGLRASYTYTNARGEADERLVRRPMHEAALGLDWDATDSTRLTLDVRRVVDNLDQVWAYAGAPVLRLPDYTLVNLSVTHRLSETVSLQARVHNVTDSRHYDVMGYATQPRTLYVGFRATF